MTRPSSTRLIVAGIFLVPMIGFGVGSWFAHDAFVHRHDHDGWPQLYATWGNSQSRYVASNGTSRESGYYSFTSLSWSVDGGSYSRTEETSRTAGEHELLRYDPSNPNVTETVGDPALSGALPLVFTIVGGLLSLVFLGVEVLILTGQRPAKR